MGTSAAAFGISPSGAADAYATGTQEAAVAALRAQFAGRIGKLPGYESMAAVPQTAFSFDNTDAFVAQLQLQQMSAFNQQHQHQQRLRAQAQQTQQPPLQSNPPAQKDVNQQQKQQLERKRTEQIIQQHGFGQETYVRQKELNDIHDQRHRQMQNLSQPQIVPGKGFNYNTQSSHGYATTSGSRRRQKLTPYEQASLSAQPPNAPAINQFTNTAALEAQTEAIRSPKHAEGASQQQSYFARQQPNKPPRQQLHQKRHRHSPAEHIQQDAHRGGEESIFNNKPLPPRIQERALGMQLDLEPGVASSTEEQPYVEDSKPDGGSNGMTLREQLELATKTQSLSLLDLVYRTPTNAPSGQVEPNYDAEEQLPERPWGSGQQSTEATYIHDELEKMDIRETDDDDEDFFDDDGDDGEIQDEGGGGQGEGHATIAVPTNEKTHESLHVPERGRPKPEVPGFKALQMQSNNSTRKPDVLLAGASRSNPSLGSAMDLSLAMGLSLGSGVLKMKEEDQDLMPYFTTITGAKRPRSQSGSGRNMPSESKDLSEYTAELGQQYYTRKPSAALSGGLKYNGAWSGNMSDILGTGFEGSSSESALLPLWIPELGGSRGSYGNSVSPLGITLTSSPRPAIAFSHRGFQSQRTSTNQDKAT